MNKKMGILTTLFVIASILISVAPAQAYIDPQTVTFDNCSTNNSGDVTIGKMQMSVSVYRGDGEQVKFVFNNSGPEESSITDVYFEDGALLGIATIVNGTGVSFSQYASPGDLPAGNDCYPPFSATVGFTADSDSPTQPNGVNPGEWVTVIFNLKDDKTYDDVINDLRYGGLRIGIHVQGFASGGSESFVSVPPTAVILVGFGATANRQAVNLAWTTGTEMNNAGFNLYRSATLAGPQNKVNGGLLRAAGEGVSGADYHYVDQPGYGVFYYWLEDVDYTGRTTLHGPVAVTVKSPYRLPAYRPAVPGY